MLTLHTGTFYLQQKIKMKNQSNIQEYCRYRDAQSHIPRKVIEEKTKNDNFKKNLYFSRRFFIINIYKFLVIYK